MTQQQRQRYQLWMVCGLMVMVCLVAVVRPAPMPQLPPRIPAQQAEVWMADCLPGVGIKTRAQVTEYIRHGDLKSVPHRAHETARAVFSGLLAP